MSQGGRMRLVHVCVAGVLLSGMLFAGKRVTLDELIRLSMEHSPDIKKSGLDVQSAQKQEAIVRGDYLPRLDAYAGISEGEYHASNGLSSDSRIITGALSASQLLYDFGKTGGIVDAKGHQLQAMDIKMQRVEAVKVFSVKRDYYAVLKRNKIIKVQEENVKLSRQQLHRANKYFEAGIRTKVDISDAQLKLTSAELASKNAQYDKKLAVTQLIQTVGYIPQDHTIRLSEKKIPLPAPSKHLPAPKGSLYANLNYAYEHRDELKFQEQLIKAAKAMVRSKEGGYYPTLTLDGSYINNDIESSSPLEAVMPDKRWSVGVNMNWNLFEGFKTDNRVEESKLTVQKAKSTKDEIKLQVKRDVTDAYLMVKKAKDALVLSENLVKTSKEKHLQSQKRYENDLADFIELQEAQNDYIVALTRVTNAYYDYHIAMAYLDLAIGKKYAAK